LYGLHRARREIGAQNRSIVVEGYMDVISLAQFTVENVVATLGTATTRTHIQRLFRLAPEIVFCFDGDRAGRDAGWKALQVALPEMQDGRQVGFLFLPEGEDPDTIVRSEGSDAFNQRVDQATPLPDFLFDSLVSQVDMSRMDGKARLVSLVKPLLAQFPRGALRDMMYSRLSAISGLNESQLGSREASLQTRTGRKRSSRSPLDSGQVSPLALATSMLLQNPELGNAIEESDQVTGLAIQGAEVLIKICELVRAHPDLSTARLLESFRDSSYHSYLEKLAVRPNMIDEDALEQQFRDTLQTLLDRQKSARREELLEKSRLKTLQQDEKVELVELLNERITTT
jgi:DNA primase